MFEFFTELRLMVKGARGRCLRARSCLFHHIQV
jgi:hypothetical protein